MLQVGGMKNLEKEEYRTWFDGNIYEHPRVTAAGPMNVIEYFEEYKKGFKNLKISAELEDMLFALKPKYHLVIISSIDDEIINPYLERSKINNIFEEVWGIRKKTSKVDKFKKLLDQFNLKKEECYFITDTLGDVKEANKVGIESIGVTWGYHDKETLLRGNPVAIVDTPRKLLDLLLQSE